MPAKAKHRNVTIRFYTQEDKDLLKWFDSLPKGEGNEQIKTLLRQSLRATSGEATRNSSAPGVTVTQLDEGGLLAALEKFVPRLREIMDAALESTSFSHNGHGGNSAPDQDKNRVPASLVSNHILDDENEDLD